MFQTKNCISHKTHFNIYEHDRKQFVVFVRFNFFSSISWPDTWCISLPTCCAPSPPVPHPDYWLHYAPCRSRTAAPVWWKPWRSAHTPASWTSPSSSPSAAPSSPAKALTRVTCCGRPDLRREPVRRSPDRPPRDPLSETAPASLSLLFLSSTLSPPHPLPSIPLATEPVVRGDSVSDETPLPSPETGPTGPVTSAKYWPLLGSKDVTIHYLCRALSVFSAGGNGACLHWALTESTDTGHTRKWSSTHFRYSWSYLM